MTLLDRNDCGKFATVVRVPKSAPSFDGQEHTPVQYLYDEELQEWVSFYWMDKKIRVSGGGAQSDWLENNADANDATEFGLKITTECLGNGTAKSAAFAMYQRQKAAAEIGCAPPVHGMCCVKAYDKKNKRLTTYWGYLSCVAYDVGCVSEDSDALSEYEAYVSEQADKWEKYDEIDSLLDDMGIYANRIRCDIQAEIGEHPDNLDYETWCEDNGYSPFEGVSNLRRNLRGIDLTDFQSDWDKIGVVFESDERQMGGDLHRNNIGYWNDDVVCIDFGHHCIGDQ